MTVLDALRILELPITPNISLQDLKANFRRLMREYHPDLHPEIDDHISANLNEAYSIIKTSLDCGELGNILNKALLSEQYDRVKRFRLLDKYNSTVIITAEQLCQIYKGKTLKLETLDNITYSLNKENKGMFKLIVVFNLQIKPDSSIKDTCEEIVEVLKFPYTQRDVYSTSIDIPVESIDTDYKALLVCADTQLNLSIPKGIRRIQVRLRLDYDIILDITFTKKIII